MKLQRTFFLVFISTFFSFQFAFSQHKYYIGIPNHVAFVRDSTRIMMDVLPWNWNARLQENEFDIEPDGRVSAPGIRKSLFPALDEQALRIVSDMPRWRPAIKDGRPVRCHYVIPMYYSLGF